MGNSDSERLWPWPKSRGSRIGIVTWHACLPNLPCWLCLRHIVKAIVDGFGTLFVTFQPHDHPTHAHCCSQRSSRSNLLRRSRTKYVSQNPFPSGVT